MTLNAQGDANRADDLREALSSPVYDDIRAHSYIALDVPTWDAASAFVDGFGPAVTGYKVGLELFHGDGPRAISALVRLGKRIFLDVKLHDIPNTVAGALREIRDEGVEMVNVHAMGGRKMLTAAREALEGGKQRPQLIGVTVLTSLSDADLLDLGYDGKDAAALAESLTRLCVDAGLDGVVTSALELERLRTFTPAGFEFVVPGTRPAGAPLHDQARSLTPGAALAAGATHLVLGRAVTKAEQPVAALKQIWDEVVDYGA